MSMEWIDEALTEGVVPDELPTEVAPASDLDEVNRLMRRLRHVQRQMVQVSDQYRVEVGALKRWRDERLGTLTVTAQFIERALDGWTRNEFRVAGTRTHKLPYGVLTLRQRRTTIDVYDEDAATTFLRGAGVDDLVRTKHEVDKGAVHNALDVGITPWLALARGPVAAAPEVPAEGMEHHAVVVERMDPETGEIERTYIPGIRLSEAVDDVTGLRFNITLRDEHGEET
jgi:phage host-nuclease inhibitor protein Gam